jgi:transcriptional regulator with XRE-family HTH domain
MSKTPRDPAYTQLQAGFGQRIQWVREMVDLSQTDLAKLISTVPSTINKIETGERAPSVFNIIQIARRLRVSTDYLLLGSFLGETDPELALKLAALHPELVRLPRHMDSDKGKGQVCDKSQKPKKQRRVA